MAKMDFSPVQIAPCGTALTAVFAWPISGCDRPFSNRSSHTNPDEFAESPWRRTPPVYIAFIRT
jgi:hypothetical protein